MLYLRAFMREMLFGDLSNHQESASTRKCIENRFFR